MKKVDSTLRGPLAAEIEAALAASGRTRAVVAPAFPATGRTTVGGVQHLDGVPVHATRFAHDPVSPVLRVRSARVASRTPTCATPRRERRIWRRSCAPSTIRRRCCGSARRGWPRRSAPSTPGRAWTSRRRTGPAGACSSSSAAPTRPRASRSPASVLRRSRCRSTGATSSAQVIDALHCARACVLHPARRHGDPRAIAAALAETAARAARAHLGPRAHRRRHRRARRAPARRHRPARRGRARAGRRLRPPDRPAPVSHRHQGRRLRLPRRPPESNCGARRGREDPRMSAERVIAITMGDPTGIGPEIIAKVFADEGAPRSLVVGDVAMMRRAVAPARALARDQPGRRGRRRPLRARRDRRAARDGPARGPAVRRGRRARRRRRVPVPGAGGRARVGRRGPRRGHGAAEQGGACTSRGSSTPATPRSSPS